MPLASHWPCDRGQVTPWLWPRFPCPVLGEQRPRSPATVGIELYHGQQGRFIVLCVCLFGCRWRGRLPCLQQPRLCSCFSAVAVCLIDLVASVAGAGPVSSRPFASGPPLGLLAGAALGVGVDETRTSTIPG